MRIISPSHPLIHAFLLQRWALKDVKNIIVETDADAIKLKNYLDVLSHTEHAKKPKEYQVISGYNDVLRTIHYDETIGIYSSQIALNPPINIDMRKTGILELTQDMPLTEKGLIGWLTENGYEAKKSTDINTYLRQWDTISIHTLQGHLQISFFGEKIETIYLDTQFINTYTLISLL